MFDGLSPEVDALLNAAKSDLPKAQADAGLIEAMTLALSVDALGPSHAPVPRRRSMLGKVLTAKAAAIAGVLVLSGGVASAATGTLPDPAQNAASHAAEHVGLHIPKSDDDAAEDVNDDANDDSADTPTTVEHPDNHGKDVSTVAHDDSNTGEDHGTAVCTVASEGKCKAGADDHSGQGNSADHRKDGDHPTTSTTVNDDNSDSDNSGTSGSDDSSHSDDSGSHGGSDSSHSGSDD
jgi:hypothetical protein